MIKVKYTSDNTILKWDEHGSVMPGKGNRQVSIFGIKVFERDWNNTYVDLTNKQSKSIGFGK